MYQTLSTAWLQEEASLRSRGKSNLENRNENAPRRSKNRSGNFEIREQETCPLGCQTKHLLTACPIYQSSTVNQRWDIVKQKHRCRKCLRAHHIKDCKKDDGTSCDKCEQNHHRSLHNDKRSELPSNLNPDAPTFPNQESNTSNNNININSSKHKNAVQSVPGLCPIQKIKVADANGVPVDILAMLDTGSNIQVSFLKLQQRNLD